MVVLPQHVRIRDVLCVHTAPTVAVHMHIVAGVLVRLRAHTEMYKNCRQKV